MTVCRIRLFPTLISEITRLGSILPLNEHDENILNRTDFRMFSESKRIRLDSTKSNSDLGFYIPSLIGKKRNTINVYQKKKF